MPLRMVEARVYVHATENRDKVVRALMETFPGDLRGKVSISEETYEGHYGNPILVITGVLEGREEARSTLVHIASRLPSHDLSYLLSTLEDRVNREGALYIRLGKQEAYLGRLRILESDDVVRVIFRFSGGRRRALEEYRRLLGGVRG